MVSHISQVAFNSTSDSEEAARLDDAKEVIDLGDGMLLLLERKELDAAILAAEGK